MTAAWSRSVSRISAAVRRSRSTRADIEEKFTLNVRHGGWDDKRASGALKQLAKLYEGKVDLAFLRG